MRRTAGWLLLMLLAWNSVAAEWVESYRTAKNLAIRQNKKILIFFTGSDWCPAGQELERNLFRSDAFHRLADEKFVLYRADFPKYARIGQEKEDRNRSLSRRYGIFNFPAVVVVEPKYGGMLARQIGMGGGMTPKMLLEKLAAVGKNAAGADRKRTPVPAGKQVP